MNMATTRGCPFKCNWCAKPIYGNRYNSRSPENVVDELKLLKEKYQFDHIWFCDDIFGLKPGWVNEFATWLKKNIFNFRFKIQSRADLLVQEELCERPRPRRLRQCMDGCRKRFAEDTGCDGQGHYGIADLSKQPDLLKKHGMKPSFFIQFGYPGETKEDI